MKTKLFFLACICALSLIGCDSSDMLMQEDFTEASTDVILSPDVSASIGSTDEENSAPFIAVFSCVPGSYLLTFNNFDPTIQVKYAIFDLESNEMVDHDILILTNQHRHVTTGALKACTPYRVVVEARNYPGDPLFFYDEIITTWWPGQTVC